jgi:predicted nicotinamide N-methyase
VGKGTVMLEHEFIVPAQEVLYKLGTRAHKVHLPVQDEKAAESLWQKKGAGEFDFPFWMGFWPSALGLLDFFERESYSLQNSLEIGCGSGIIAQAWHKHERIYHTDLMLDALFFVKKYMNNREARFFVLDFLNPAIGKKFDFVFGSDILYEDRLCDAVPVFLDKHLADGGKCIIADPERSGRDQIYQRLQHKNLDFARTMHHYQVDGVEKSCYLYHWERK